jgi:hypothetical protein
MDEQNERTGLWFMSTGKLSQDALFRAISQTQNANGKSNRLVREPVNFAEKLGHVGRLEELKWG